MTHRIEQLESAIRRRIGELLARGLADPRVRGMITVTEVKLSDDQSQAVIGISVLPEEHSALTLKGVVSAATYLRRELGATLTTRRVPRLIFKLDDRLKKQAEVIAAVNEAMAQTGPGESDAPAESDGPDAAGSAGVEQPEQPGEPGAAGATGAAERKRDAAGGSGRGADDEIERSSPTDEDQDP